MTFQIGNRSRRPKTVMQVDAQYDPEIKVLNRRLHSLTLVTTKMD